MGWPSKDPRDYAPPPAPRDERPPRKEEPRGGAPHRLRLEVAAIAAIVVGLPLWFLIDHGHWLKITGLVFVAVGAAFELWWKASGREPVPPPPRPQLPDWGPSKDPDDYR